MNGDEAAERRHEAASWMRIAREDLRVARACLSLDPPARGVAAYHCQQAAEKLVKGLLVAASTYPECRDLLDSVRTLTVWGFAYRYPGTEDISEPVPGEVELRRTIDLIERPGERLQAAAAPTDTGVPH